jgi:hypothetical protein
MPDLIVRDLKTRKEVSRVTVTHPFSTIRGQEKYEVVMMGMLRNMNTEDYYIDDSEIDKARINDPT